MGNEKLNLEMTKLLSSNKTVTVLRVPESKGVRPIPSLASSVDRRARARRPRSTRPTEDGCTRLRSRATFTAARPSRRASCRPLPSSSSSKTSKSTASAAVRPFLSTRRAAAEQRAGRRGGRPLVRVAHRGGQDGQGDVARPGRPRRPPRARRADQRRAGDTSESVGGEETQARRLGPASHARDQDRGREEGRAGGGRGGRGRGAERGGRECRHGTCHRLPPPVRPSSLGARRTRS